MVMVTDLLVLSVLCKAKTGCVNLGGRLQGVKMMVPVIMYFARQRQDV